MNNVRPHMAGTLNGIAFQGAGAPPALNGLSGMGGVGAMANMGGMGMGGMNAMGGMGLGVGGQHPHHSQQQQHGQQPHIPGQPPPMGILQQNHPGQPQLQQPQHGNPPPMGNLQPGQNQGGAQLGQQAGGMPFMQQRDQMIRANMERQRLQQQQQQQQHQQQQQNQGQQPGQPPQMGQQGQGHGQQGFPAGMSLMGNFGSPRAGHLVHTGQPNGMGPNPMAGLGGIGGAGFQGIPPNGNAMAMGIRHVPSQPPGQGQPNPQQQQQQQPAPGGGVPNAGMNMNMLGGMGVNVNMGGVGLGMMRQQGGMQPGGPQQQRIASYPGGPQQLPPGQGPGPQRSISNMGNLPPEFAAAISQDTRLREQREQQQAQIQQQQQQHLSQQQVQQHGGIPRTPSVVNAVPPMPNGAGAGGPMPNGMNPGAIGAQNMQRTTSAMGAPGLAPAGMHPGHPNHPNHAGQLPHGGQPQPTNQPPFAHPLHQVMPNPQIQHQHPHQGQQHPHQPQQPPQQPQQHPMGPHTHQQQAGMPMASLTGPNMGGMQGHPGQQNQRATAGSPTRPGTGGHSQPQTPSNPVSAVGMRPQSSTGDQPPILAYAGGPPPFGGIRQNAPHQHPHPNPHTNAPGQPGQIGHQYAMAGRVTPQLAQSPMAALGNSPGGPITGRPGSSNGHGPVVGGISTPNMGNLVGSSGRAGPVPGVPPGGPPGGGVGFPTPAQQLASEQQTRNNSMSYAGAMPPMTQQHGMGTPGGGPLGTPNRPPTGQAHPHPHPLGHGQPPYGSPIHQQQQQGQQQRDGSPAVHRQPTPSLQHSGGGPFARTGTPTLAHGMAPPGPPGPHGMQQNRPQSRNVNRAPSRQQNHAQGNPGAGAGQGQTQGQGPGQGQQQAQTPRTQAAQLPSTPGAGPSGGPGATPVNRMSSMNMMGRAGVGLGINQPQAGPSSGGPGQQPHPQNTGPQQQNVPAGPQQRPGAQDGAIPAPMMGMGPFMAQRQMFGPWQALNRLMTFSDSLSQPMAPPTKEYWEGLVQEYFSQKSVINITLWKDSLQAEAKQFDISTQILPRFFLVTSHAGVTHMSFNFENVKERAVPGSPYSMYVDCPNAAWTFYYANGYVVTLRGPLSATLAWVPNPAPQPPSTPGANGAPPPASPPTLKIEMITFNAAKHEKMINVERIQGKRGDPIHRTPKMKAEGSPGMASSSTMDSSESPPGLEEERASGELVIHLERATIPTEPVNAFGIPQATMRCLELAESVGHMSELIEFSLNKNMGPLDALKNYARMLRDSGFVPQPVNQGSPGQLMDAHLTNGVASTLYQNSPPIAHAATNPGGLQAQHSMAHRPGPSSIQGPGDTASPSMAHTPASAQTPNAPPLSAAPTSTSSTPMVAHATLKRKVGDTSSPTTATAEQQQPPAKRTARKRNTRPH